MSGLCVQASIMEDVMRLSYQGLKKGLSALSVASLTILALSACETDEDNKIAKAQACLNNATASSVSNCTAMISGLSSARSYLIRCSADFIAQGFGDPDKFAQAFSALQDEETGSSGSPMLSMLGHMAFDSTANANQAFSNCTASGVKGMTMFASMVRMSTIITNASAVVPSGPDGSYTPEDMADVLQDGSFDDQSDEELGESVIAAHGAYCQEINESNAEMCNDLQSAIDNGSGDTAEIGQQVRCTMDNDAQPSTGCS